MMPINESYADLLIANDTITAFAIRVIGIDP